MIDDSVQFVAPVIGDVDGARGVGGDIIGESDTGKGDVKQQGIGVDVETGDAGIGSDSGCG